MSSLVVLEREKLTERLRDPTHSGPKWPQMPNDQQVLHVREEGSHEETFKIRQETQKNNKNKHKYKINPVFSDNPGLKSATLDLSGIINMSCRRLQA